MIHRRIHTGVKLYACDTCGKGFVRSDKLALHMRTHTGESAYTCGTCGERFIQSAMLKTHMRSHTGETLDCKTCGRCFSQKSHLLRRMKIHTRKTKPAWNAWGRGRGFRYQGDFQIWGLTIFKLRLFLFDLTFGPLVRSSTSMDGCWSSMSPKKNVCFTDTTHF